MKNNARIIADKILNIFLEDQQMLEVWQYVEPEEKGKVIQAITDEVYEGLNTAVNEAYVICY